MTKYRVYTETGFREFKEVEYEQAVQYHTEYGIQPIEPIEYELVVPDVDI